MEEYPSNSHKSREAQQHGTPEKKVEKVVTGEVAVRKKNGVQKFAESLIAGGAESVRDYIIKEIVMPKARDILFDIVGSLCDNFKDGTRALLYGKDSPKDGGTVVSSTGSVTKKRALSYSSPNLTFQYRGEAEKVLEEMRELLSTYGIVSVADMCEAAGIMPNSTDNNFGWNSLETARVDRVREGWVLKLPKAIPLD